jgi:hypothetical protein
VRLQPVPRAQHPGQLIIAGALVPVIRPGGRIGEQRQIRAPRQHIQHQPVPNAAARLPDSPGKTPAEPGWPGPRRPPSAAIAASAPAVPDRAPPSGTPGHALDRLADPRELPGRQLILTRGGGESRLR